MRREEAECKLEGLHCETLMRHSVVEHIFKWKSLGAKKRISMDRVQRGVCKGFNVSVRVNGCYVDGKVVVSYKTRDSEIRDFEELGAKTCYAQIIH